MSPRSRNNSTGTSEERGTFKQANWWFIEMDVKELPGNLSSWNLYSDSLWLKVSVQLSALTVYLWTDCITVCLQGLVPSRHRLTMCQLAVQSSDWIRWDSFGLYPTCIFLYVNLCVCVHSFTTRVISRDVYGPLIHLLCLYPECKSAVCLQGGPLGVLPGHLANHLQRAGASPWPDEGKDIFIMIIYIFYFEKDLKSVMTHFHSSRGDTGED